LIAVTCRTATSASSGVIRIGLTATTTASGASGSAHRLVDTNVLRRGRNPSLPLCAKLPRCQFGADVSSCAPTHGGLGC
jgi:hypothetical protein